MNQSGLSWSPDHGVGVDKNSPPELWSVWNDYIAVGIHDSSVNAFILSHCRNTQRWLLLPTRAGRFMMMSTN